MQKAIFAALLLSSATVFANEAADETANHTGFASQRTRAEVLAEVIAARKSDTIRIDEYAANLRQVPDAAARSKGEVRAEALVAARSRVIHELY